MSSRAPSFSLPVVKPRDLRGQSSVRAVQAVVNTIAPELCEDAGGVYEAPREDNEVSTDTRSNLAPRRRVELD